MPTSVNLITSTGTGDSVLTRPAPLLPTRITSCKSEVLAVKIIFIVELTATCLFVSKPIELNSKTSLAFTAILKDPFLEEVVTAFEEATLIVTPSSAFPFESLTTPLMV